MGVRPKSCRDQPALQEKHEEKTAFVSKKVFPSPGFPLTLAARPLGDVCVPEAAC